MFLIALLTLALDQISKLAVRTLMEEGSFLALIPGVLHLTRVHNYGAAFGFLNYRVSLFIVLSAIVSLAIAVFGRRYAAGRRLMAWGLGLLLGGALGNLVDRLWFGRVTDFIDFRFWPVFNLADIAIVAGVVLVCWEVLRDSGEEKRGG